MIYGAEKYKVLRLKPKESQRTLVVGVVKNDVANKIVAAFPEINKEWLIGNDANMLKKRASPFDEPYTPEPKPDKKTDVLKQLENIKSQNGKTTEIYTIFKEKRELEELKKISIK